MTKALGGTGIFTSILFGAIIWFVLQVIIGVVAWVSIVAGGVVAIIGICVALGVVGAHETRKHHAGRGSTLGSH